MEKAEPIAPVPQGSDLAVAVTLTTALTDRRSIVMHTYIARDASLYEYNVVIDKLGRAVDRQEAKYRLDALLITLKQHEDTLAQLKDDYANIEVRNAAEWRTRGKKGDPQLSANEQAQKSNAAQNIKRYGVEINKLKADIEACKATIAKDG